jgi:polysaccharide deacetylase family protein (PEP-CTERM system associated)
VKPTGLNHHLKFPRPGKEWLGDSAGAKPVAGLSVDVDDVMIAFSHFYGLSCRNYRTTIAQEIAQVVDLLERHQAKATFFVPGYILEVSPDLLRPVLEAGHEIACHGFRHIPIWQMSPEDFEQDLIQAVELIRARTGRIPVGYRAPGATLLPAADWAVPILIRHGFRYSSSCPAVAVRHHRFKVPPRRPFLWPGGLLELPPSTQKLFGLSWPVCGSVYARLSPGWLTKLATHMFLGKAEGPLLYYFHPFEAFPQSVAQAWPNLNLTAKVYLWGCRGFRAKLEWVLKQCDFQTYERVAENYLREN